MFVRIELTSGFNKEILLSVFGFPGKVRIEIDRKSALVEPTFVDSEKVFSQKFSLFPADDIKEAMPFEEEFNASLTANLSPYIRSGRKIGLPIRARCNITRSTSRQGTISKAKQVSIGLALTES